MGTTWTTGRFGKAAAFNGVSDHIDLPTLGTFYATGFTYEAWVRKLGSKKDVAVLGTFAGHWADDLGRPRRRALSAHARWKPRVVSGLGSDADHWPVGTCCRDVRRQHSPLLRRGVEVATQQFSGQVGSSNTWRLGAYDSTPAGFFDGHIDNVRVYDRALTPDEIQTDMASRIQPESFPPTVIATTPADGAATSAPGARPSVTFNEPMKASTITSNTFQLSDADNVVLPATVTYNAATNTATLTPHNPQEAAATYTATVKGGAGGGGTTSPEMCSLRTSVGRTRRKRRRRSCWWWRRRRSRSVPISARSCETRASMRSRRSTFRSSRPHSERIRRRRPR